MTGYASRKEGSMQYYLITYTQDGVVANALTDKSPVEYLAYLNRFNSENKNIVHFAIEVSEFDYNEYFDEI